jgi:oxalate---CoA ligase
MTEMEIPLEIERWAIETPRGAALAAPKRTTLSYSALLDHINLASAAFREAGAHPGTVAVLALPNGPEFVTAALAISMRSACAPLDLSLTAEEYRRYLPRIRASALVCEEGADLPVVDAARELGMRLIRVRPSPSAPAGVFELAGTEGAGDRAGERQIDAGFVFHTSATTEAPKLVPRNHAASRVAARQDAAALELHAADRFLSLMPLCHGHGIGAIFTQLICGGSAFCAPRFDPRSFLASLEGFRPTWFSADPTLMRAILTLARQNLEVFRKTPLRFIRSAGAPPNPDTVRGLEELLGIPVLDGYGLTEVPSVARNTPSLRRPGSAGKSTGTGIGIMDPSGNLLLAESEGEVVLRGATVMPGYLDNPEVNRSVFHDGWFRTGDIGRLDRDGFLFIVGRTKEIINRGGKKIVPQEVDNALAQHPALADVATFAIAHRTLGEDVAAAVVMRPGGKATELGVRRTAAEHLAPYKIPRRVVFVDEIPRTASGKPKRNLLAEAFKDLALVRTMASTGPVEQTRPLTEVESKLVDIWRDVLGVEEIGVDDDFFYVGGDSITVAIMLAQTAERLGIGRDQIREGGFLDQPTIATLARIVLGKASATPSGGVSDASPHWVVVLRDEGSRIPFFCFSSSEVELYEFRHISQELGRDQPFIALCPPPAVQENRLLKMEDLARQSIAAIRAVREHGPYILGGYCKGVFPAFETARQLMAEGEEVALLVLFDARTPGYPKIARQWRSYARALLRSLSGGEDRITFREILTHIGHTCGIKTKRIAAKVTRAKVAAGAKDPREVTGWKSAARREYVPHAFDAPILNFLAEKRLVSTRVLSDPRFGWRELAKRSFEVRWLPTDHFSMFTKNNAPLLAAELAKAFEAAAAAVGARPEEVATAEYASTGVGNDRGAEAQ